MKMRAGREWLQRNHDEQVFKVAGGTREELGRRLGAVERTL